MREVHDLSVLVDVIAEIAGLALSRGDDVGAERLLAGVARLSEETGLTIYDRADYDDSVAGLRARLAPKKLERHWQEGASLERADLVEAALQSVELSAPRVRP